METKKLLTLISLLIFFLSFGQNSVLWKVTNKNTALTSYILGTYHLTGKEFVKSHPIILEKMKAADLVITETEINRSKFSAYYNLRPSSDTLSTILSPEDLAYLKEIFADGKIDLEKYTPGELLLKLQVYYPKYRCTAIKNSGNLPMDEYIQQLADLNKKELYYLESDSLGLAKIAELTKKYDWKSFKRQIPGILKKYRSQKLAESECNFANNYTTFDLNYSFGTFCHTIKGKPGNTDLVQSRTNGWLTQIPSLLAQKSCFIAVGLQHLYFECGLLEQLEKLGYTVEKVEMK